jgi:hypothetical protein
VTNALAYCGNELILPVKKFCGTSQWSTGKLIDALDFGRKHIRINKVWRGERKEDRSGNKPAEYSTTECEVELFTRANGSIGNLS